MPRLVYFMYKGLKNAMSLVLYMRDFFIQRSIAITNQTFCLL